MPRLTARRHSLRCFILHIHNQTKLGRQVLRSSFYVRVLTQATNDLCGSHCSCFVGYSYERGLPLTFSQACLTWWQLLRHCKRYGHKGAAFKASRHHSGVVQWISATSYAFFTVTHQNGFSSTIQSACNLKSCLYKLFILIFILCRFISQKASFWGCG